MKNANHKESPSVENDVINEILQLIAEFRVELALFIPPVVLGVLLYLRFGVVGPAMLLILVGVALATRSTREWLLATLRGARVRRRVQRSLKNLPGLLGERPPRVKKVSRTRVGNRVELRLAAGTSINDVAKVEETLASDLKARRVRSVVNPTNRNRVILVISKGDPFEDSIWRTTLPNTLRTSLWDPIPVGVNEDDEVVTINLVEHASLLVGGLPGGGKSVVLTHLVAHAALDPMVDLWLLDGKDNDLAPWVYCARRYVGREPYEAIILLEMLITEMDMRYEQMRQRDIRKVTRDDSFRLQVLVIDELSTYSAGLDKKDSARFVERLRDVVARGRAAGIIVIAATQRPSVDIVPAALRDLFGFRWALRCTTRDASDTVLGVGWAARGYSADDIDAGQPGVGILLHEGGLPVRLRSFFLSDLETKNIIAYVLALQESRARSKP